MYQLGGCLAKTSK